MTASAWLIEHWGLIATMLWASCELLAQMTFVKANSFLSLFFQGVIDALKNQVVAKPVVIEKPPNG